MKIPIPSPVSLSCVASKILVGGFNDFLFPPLFWEDSHFD